MGSRQGDPSCKLQEASRQTARKAFEMRRGEPGVPDHQSQGPKAAEDLTHP